MPSTESVSVVQHEENPISVAGDVSGGSHIGHTIIYNDLQPLTDKNAELAGDLRLVKKELEELKADLQEANKAKLQAEYANRDNIVDYKKHALELWHKGKKEEAIKSVDTDVADEEAANRHIFKAELLIDNFQFDEAEQHYKQAAAVFPSYDNIFTIADFYYDLNKFPEAIEYYNLSLNLADLPENKTRILNDMGNAQQRNNDYSEAETSYNKALKIHRQLAKENPKAYLPDVAMTLNNLAILHRNINEYPKALEEYEEALKIHRQLAKENPKAYLPDVAMTLNNLSMFYQDYISDNELSLKYANEAIEVLGRCSDTPFVKEEIEKAKQVIEKWSKNYDLES